MDEEKTSNCSTIKRKNIIASRYEIGGDREKWDNLIPKETIDKTISLLVANNILPVPKDNSQKITIFSPSSNTGFFESALKEELGDQYIIIASDLADLRNRYTEGEQLKIRADAYFPPLENNSIDVIFDRRGAMWHSANIDEELGNRENVMQLFEVYRNKLKEGGILIIDNDVGFDASTVALLKDVNLGELKGFDKPIIIGEMGCRYQIYKKLPKK